MSISSILIYQLISVVLTAVLAFTAIVQTYNSLKYGIYARMEPKFSKDGEAYMDLIIGNTGPGIAKDISWKLEAYSPGETGFDILYNESGKIAMIPPKSNLELYPGIPYHESSLISKVNAGDPQYFPDIEEFRSFDLIVKKPKLRFMVVSLKFSFYADGRLSKYEHKNELREKWKNKKSNLLVRK
jgi:hypothetical protein